MSQHTPNPTQQFQERMLQELETNAHKGNWHKWTPLLLEWILEMNHHLNKLYKALREDNKERICEYSADVANLALKAYTLFGKPNECRTCDGTGEYLESPPAPGTCTDCDGSGTII